MLEKIETREIMTLQEAQNVKIKVDTGADNTTTSKEIFFGEEI